MTILTPNFAEAAPLTNGQAGPHVLAAHEPLRSEPTLALPPSPPLAVPVPVPPPNTPLKIALVGTAPSSRMLAPYNDPSWKIWACSPGNMNTLPRVDIWFELHSNLLWPEYQSYGLPYIEWLKQQKFPIYMQALWPTAEGTMAPLSTVVPNATAFPVNEMVAEFGDEFFTSSFAWMLAMAITQGATEIALYGIDMASRDEYILQRPGFYYFKREAIRRGIKVSAPHESDIMQSPALYAYVDSTPFGRKIAARKAEVSGRVAQFDQQIGQATNSKVYLQGALEDLDYFASIWSGVCNKMHATEYENTLLKAKVTELLAKIAELSSVPAWVSGCTVPPYLNIAPLSASYTVSNVPQPYDPRTDDPPPVD